MAFVEEDAGKCSHTEMARILYKKSFLSTIS